MGLDLKQSTLDLDINIDWDFIPWALKGVQSIYSLRLKREWNGRKILDGKESREFMSFALLHLLPGSFIRFEFCPSEEYFIQFSKQGGYTVMDLPVYFNNIYSGKGEELIAFLKRSGIKQNIQKDNKPVFTVNTFRNQKDPSDKSIQVFFDDDSMKAAELAVSIVDEILGVRNPRIFHYETARLIPIS